MLSWIHRQVGGAAFEAGEKSVALKQYSRALRDFRRAEASLRRGYGEGHDFVRQAIAHQAYCLEQVGQLLEAVKLYERAKEMTERLEGPESELAQEIGGRIYWMRERLRQRQSS